MARTYRDAGVDAEAGRKLVDRIRPVVKRTTKSEIIDNDGGFAALALIPDKFENPILVSGTDGVGTKIDLLIQHERVDTVGFDLVAMCVNDILVYGAEPLLFLDYFASGKLDVDVAEKVITSIAQACELAGCSLVGGETAEMPGFYPHRKFDLAGFALGVVEKDRILKSKNVKRDDVLIGLYSNGAHSNGFSLIRKLLADAEAPSDKVLDQILAPTQIYAKALLPNIDKVHSMAHITGGGFSENLPRAFDETLCAHIDLNSWTRHECFDWIQSEGPVDELEMFGTFNCGIGMILISDKYMAEGLLAQLRDDGVKAELIGHMAQISQPARSAHLVVSKQNTYIA